MKNRKKIIWLGVLALVLLHHDFWWWDDPSLVFGFLPLGLAYHMGFSIAASTLWLVYVKFAWPNHIEEFAAGGPSTPPESKPPAP